MPVLIWLREKLWTRTYSVGDQVPTCPVFTRAKIKSRFGILVNLPSQYIYIYIYIYWQHFFINTNFVEHNRHFLSTYFLVDRFILPYWFYNIRRELIDIFSIIVYIPSTFSPTLGHHQGRIYYKSEVTFVFALYIYIYIYIYTNSPVLSFTIRCSLMI